MSAVTFIVTPAIATALFSMAMKVPNHEYYSYPQDDIRFIAIRAMLFCCPSHVNTLIHRARQILPRFEESEPSIVTQETDILKTLALGRYLTAQNKENIEKFFKDLPLKANL